jgi:hypothetical protein
MLSHAERVKQRDGGDGGGGAISEHCLRGMRGGKSFSGIQKIEQSKSGTLILILLFRGSTKHTQHAQHTPIAHTRTYSTQHAHT